MLVLSCLFVKVIYLIKWGLWLFIYLVWFYKERVNDDIFGGVYVWNFIFGDIDMVYMYEDLL